jgi:hypothetical protein
MPGFRKGDALAFFKAFELNEDDYAVLATRYDLGDVLAFLPTVIGE